MILIVDDDAAQRRMIAKLLAAAGHAWAEVESGEAAVARLDDPGAETARLVLLDLSMPGLGGIETLSEIRKRDGALPVIVLTANGSISNAVEAMRAGANDFLIKPVAPERLKVSIANALRLGDLTRQVRQLSKTEAGAGFSDLIARSETTRKAIRLASRAAQSTIPILIEGESGVGKEVFAGAIHGSSDRAAGPFVAVNCGALPENLVESILFGHEKGAFTGAVARRVGKFAEAHGGTLFLDEVGELPLEAQVKLLRAVQTGEVDPVGAAKAVRTDFRLISATNRELADEIEAGRFRRDLYYRLSVLPLTLPPLRERREDIAPLAERFAADFAAQEGKHFAGFTPAARRTLTEAPWPGNVRQLENALYRAVVLSDTETLDSHDFTHIAGAPTPTPAVAGANGEDRPAPRAPATTPEAADGHIRPLAELEAEAIAAALRRYDGRISEAARRLGIGRSTLYRKIKDYELDKAP